MTITSTIFFWKKHCLTVTCTKQKHNDMVYNNHVLVIIFNVTTFMREKKKMRKRERKIAKVRETERVAPAVYYSMFSVPCP